ncbi:hypothetical protein PoB_002915400 [Plakobranchus ocellatus]|uniref:Uncharacterized protein n=1 Tax=Plakobranchus ocellatus TaxID=259542 RepID=A0AAV4A808_9GAST|nr:hypothetical protein PoB_002915400 [Plakobranchus ocellatus]
MMVMVVVVAVEREEEEEEQEKVAALCEIAFLCHSHYLIYSDFSALEPSRYKAQGRFTNCFTTGESACLIDCGVPLVYFNFIRNNLFCLNLLRLTFQMSLLRRKPKTYRRVFDVYSPSTPM